MDGWIALALGLALLIGALHDMLGPASETQPPGSVTVAAARLMAHPGAALPIQRVLGSTAGLLDPHGAAMLDNGLIVVLDTGNHRLALLNPGGRLQRSITRGSALLARIIHEVES